MKLNKMLFVALTFALLLSAFLPALAQDYGLNATAGAAGLSKADVPTVIGSIIGYALSFIGVLFMGLLLYGGFLWMTSYGNTQKVDRAKELITDAIIGLVIIIAAYAITNFVIGALVQKPATTP